MFERIAATMKVLVINAGSSSVKYFLYQMPGAEVLARGLVEKIGEETSTLSHFYHGKIHPITSKIEDVQKAIELILQTLADEEVGALQQISEIGAVGHRVVHGGEEFTDSVIINDKVIASIKKFADLAPLHNPPNLAGILAAQHHLPNVKQVACFDTKSTASEGTAFAESLTDTWPVGPQPLWAKGNMRSTPLPVISETAAPLPP
jgi:acetate kinase